MNNRQSYDLWSKTYDTVENKTRDLEAAAFRESFSNLQNSDILEIGCGTGKNTEFLLSKARRLVGADFSGEMLAQAREKIKAENIEFRQLDLREKWNFEEHSFDLITCSLALEHLENLDFVFSQAQKTLRRNGLFYLGELHPFKQYSGSKARFQTENGVLELECFVHHISEYFEAAKRNSFQLVDFKEWFDTQEKTQIPRILTMIFQSKS